METTLPDRNAASGNGILYPMLVIVAVLVIILSMLSAFALTGILPTMPPDPAPEVQQRSALLPVQAARLGPAPGAEGVNAGSETDSNLMTFVR